MSRIWAEMFWNLTWKSPGLVPFGANLTHFGAKSGNREYTVVKQTLWITSIRFTWLWGRRITKLNSISLNYLYLQLFTLLSSRRPLWGSIWPHKRLTLWRMTCLKTWIIKVKHMLFSAPEQSFAKATLNISFSGVIWDDGDDCSLFDKWITFGPYCFFEYIFVIKILQ